MFEDHGSTRIDLVCPQCRKLFKVRLRKLQFGAELTCRLCRHEFPAQDVSERPEVQEALSRMRRIVAQRMDHGAASGSPSVTKDHGRQPPVHPKAPLKAPAPRESSGEAPARAGPATPRIEGV
ncbi:hypothetical protein [Microvirga makkahensis]|uniref:Uncharacterized protein n=1 Tax=Microvirga makkahensis TaxID=1128670 RepID=A0A7X3SQR8_9HYPH|nr:hypothetical protein [Microvirga makkahensis]MXQ13384.1 hypothetical protein [Microvirga makkahensis]